MEIVIPNIELLIILFIIFTIIVYYIAPTFTPLIIGIMSIILLTYGVYDHYKLFSNEYRLSTWQEGIQQYAPAIMILVLIFFIIYSILIFFTGGKVPIPEFPDIPNISNIPNQITKSVSNTTNNIISSLKTNILNSPNKTTKYLH